MRKFSRVFLLGLGLLIGAFGVKIAEKAGAVPTIAHSGAEGNVADACSPKTAQDDIFFVSCGGIY